MKKHIKKKQSKQKSTQAAVSSPGPKRPDWEAVAEKQRTPTPGELTTLSSLAGRLRSTQWEIDKKLENLAELTQIRDRIAQQDIPDLMAKFGVTEFRLKDGTRVSVKPIVRASLPTAAAIAKLKDAEEQELVSDRIDRGLAYLKQHGADSLIKNLVKLEFGKGQGKKVREVLKALHRVGVVAEVQPSVHPQTLTAWVRERLSEGKPVDMDLFSVFHGNVATVELPKQTK